ncbi:MAG: Thiol-disulfide isomerase and thioredoxin [Deltaproteobacteria bacterium]|nr:Thiol-disulfide isomerase and thioredoxin [Deltaproteobacteria bacterium]
MKIAILGSGCARCKQTADAVRQAVERAGIDAAVVKVEDFKEMMAYKVMTTPAVAVDGTIRISGRVPTVEEVLALLRPGGGGKA